MARKGSSPSFKGDIPVAAMREVLRDRRELALVAFERTRMPIVVTDAQDFDNPIVRANQAFLDLTGYSAQEVIGRNCLFLQGPDTAASDVDVVRRCLMADHDHIEVELLNYRKDGSRFWNQLVISPVHDQGDKLIYHFASQKDVTVRRDAERREASERMLLMEVDHRAMNALALVQSIVSLSRAETAEGFAASVRGRVDALARAHRLLATFQWREAEISDVVAIAAGPDGIRIDWAPDQIASRRGAAVDAGTPRIDRKRDAARRACERRRECAPNLEISADELLLHWSEVGDARPVRSPPPGLGLTLVKSLIEKQLAGCMAIVWQDQALRVDMTIPRQK